MTTVAPDTSESVLVRRPGPQELHPVRTHRRRRALELSLAMAVPLLLILWWQLAAAQGWIDDRVYPAPSTILADGWDRAAAGDLWPDVWATLRRVLAGYAIGTAAGYALGLLMGSLSLVRAALEPTLDALYVVPKLALLPIFLNMFGLGEGPQVALVAATVFFFVSWTDPAKLSPNRSPARCLPGAPSPQPLAKTRKLTIATGTLSAEYVAPLEVALDKGEFKREGLDVTLKVLPTPDALPLLAKGDVDALWAAPEAAVMNGIRGGFDIKWVAGNFSPDPKSKSGLWARLKKGETASDVRLAGRKLGTMIGKGSVISYPMEKALAQHDGGLDKIQYQQLGSADVLTALQNGGVDSAWLLDPVWRKVDGKAGCAFLGGQPQGEPLGGMLYGRGLLSDDVDAGVALLRAYIRTVNTYFAADYKEDATFVTYLAKLLKTDESILRSTPSLHMDWEIRAGTTNRLQSAYRAAGVAKGTPLPESKTVDRALYEEAVGHAP